MGKKHYMVAGFLFGTMLLSIVAVQLPANAPASFPDEGQAGVRSSVAGGELSYDLLDNGTWTSVVGKCLVLGRFMYLVSRNNTERFLVKWDTVSRTEVWRRSLGICSQTLISGTNDAIYISSTSAKLYKFLQNGTKVWNASYFDTNGGLLGIYGLWGNSSQLYIAGWNSSDTDHGSLYKIDADDGSILIKRAVPNSIYPVMWGDGDYLYIVGGGSPGASLLYKYDLGCTQIWARTGSYSDQLITGSGTTFYTACNRLVKWTPGGTLSWNVSVPGAITSICATGDAVFSINEPSIGPWKSLYKWNASDGALIWTHDFNSLPISGFSDVGTNGTNLITTGIYGGFPLIVRWSPRGFTGNANFTTSMSYTVQGIGVNFTAPVDAGDAPVQYQWDFGDGLPNATSANVSHVFSAAGDYQVKLHVKDNEGDTAFHTRTFRVSSLATDDDGDGMPNGWEIDHGLDFNLDGDANLDPDHDELRNVDEYLHGTDPRVWDTDGDGSSDGEEVRLFSDPLNPLSNMTATIIIIMVAVAVGAISIDAVGRYKHKHGVKVKR